MTSSLIQLGDAEASLQGAALLAFGATGRIALKHPPEGWFAGREINRIPPARRPLPA